MFKPATLIDPKTKKRVAVNSKEEAQRYFGQGYQLETAPPAKTQAYTQEPIRRTDSGIEKLVESPLRKMQSQSGFLNLVKEAILRQQKARQPLTEQKAYWRTMQRDALPFGSTRPPEEAGGMETDKAFRELSPQEQSSIRQARYTSAGAHLQGISEEEKYRGARLEDVMKEMKDAKQMSIDEAKAKQLATSRDLDILKKRKELGYSPTVTDVFGSYVGENGQRVGNKRGGSATWRNNNPGAIKYKYGNGNLSGVAKDLLAQGIEIKEGSPAKDGGSFIAFPTVEEGDAALKKLLTSDVYANMSVENAMRKWSNGGYGADIMSNPVSTTIGRLDENQLTDLIEGIKRRENWRKGEYLEQPNTIEHNTWTESAVRDLAYKTGISSTDLWNNYTDAELDALKRESGLDLTAEIVRKVDPNTLRKYGFKDRDELEQLLTLKNDLGATEDELVALAKSLGINVNLDSGLSDGGKPIPLTITEILDKITNK